MGSEEVRLFLSSLANSRHVAINTQKIALNALAFCTTGFYNSRWAILIISLQASLDGYPLLSLQMKCNAFAGYEYSQPSYFTLLYGAGLRINECLRLRVKDFDFDNGCITVHDGKGGKSRNSLLPTRLIPAIK